ncbi:MAG: dockerin type I repeat-containing protein [Oscillospiraceae bacterium]|nr:dockerin type I repeat-containing protein [Oscillospiraceae bacterium]
MKAKKIISFVCAFLLACSACPFSISVTAEIIYRAEYLVIDGLVYAPNLSSTGITSYDFLGVIDADIASFDVLSEIHNYPVIWDGETVNVIEIDKSAYYCSNDIYDHDIYVSTSDGRKKATEWWVKDTANDKISCAEPEKFVADGVIYKINTSLMHGDILTYTPAELEDTSVTFIPKEINGIPIDNRSSIGYVTIDGLIYKPIIHNYVSGYKIVGYNLVGVADTSFTSITIPAKINGCHVGWGKSVSSLSKENIFADCKFLEEIILEDDQTNPFQEEIDQWLEDGLLEKEDAEILKHSFDDLKFKIINGALYYGENLIGYPTVKSENKVINLNKGDVTGDGEVDITDIIVANKAILGQKPLTAEQVKALDIDQNGIVDTTDSLMIMKYIVGLIESL